MSNRPSNRPPFNRPPFKRNNNGSKKGSGKKQRQPLRRLKIALVLLLGYSALQYGSSGTVSWPGDIYRKVTQSLGDYAGRPEAGWRKATEKLEEMGAAKEGQPVPDFDLVGRVVRVADGDTVSVLDHRNKQHKVRLYGIDTPERDQPYGDRSQQALARLVADQQVGVAVVEIDDYGRTVGTLYRGESNINVAMVASGNAWWYRHYAPHNRLLEASEQEARQQGLGLWQESAPVPPWDWRRGAR